MDIIIGNEFPKKVIPLIEKAKTSIDIVVFDWRWYPQDPGSSAQLFNQAIIRAARRGVKIRAVANSSDIISFLNSQNIEAKNLRTKKVVHVKLMILDDDFVVLGSHNYTQSAFTMNYELSVVLEYPPDFSRFKEFFNNLWTLYG